MPPSSNRRGPNPGSPDPGRTNPCGATLPTRAACLLVSAILGLTGCGVESQGDGVSARPSASGPSARALLVSAQDLPAGFADSGGQDENYRQSVCGVDLEPSKPVDTASARFSQGPVGPFVEQRVRIYADDSAAAVLKRLRTALASCSRYSLPASGTAPAVTFAVQPLALPRLGEDSVAWRQVPQTDLPITTDVVLIRTGRTVVLVTSYAIKEAPSEQTVQQAAQAAAQKFSA